jgi:bacterioferritin-associated ferredoxin
MIVCHCMNITDRDIRAAVDWMRASDPETLITPGKIYRALGKKADCGGCLPHFIDTMRQSDSFEVPASLRTLRGNRKKGSQP